jgi:hypothetical protein
MKVRFKNPMNGYTESVNYITSMLMAAIFGPIYFMCVGAWGVAIVSFLLACMTLGISHIFVTICAPWLVINMYEKKGWIKVED